jgi:hypothetical protein
LPPDSPRFAETLNDLAATYEKEGLYDDAERISKHSLSILEGSPQPNYPMLVQTLRTYSLILSKTGRAIEAEPFETRALVYEARSKEQMNKHP